MVEDWWICRGSGFLRGWLHNKRKHRWGAHEHHHENEREGHGTKVGRLSLQIRGKWALRWVHYWLMLQAVLLAWAWEPGFLSSCTPLLGLEILNIVVLSPVNEHKEDDPAGEELRKRAEWKTRDAEPHGWTQESWSYLKFAHNLFDELHWRSKASCVPLCALPDTNLLFYAWKQTMKKMCWKQHC